MHGAKKARESECSSKKHLRSKIYGTVTRRIPHDRTFHPRRSSSLRTSPMAGMWPAGLGRFFQSLRYLGKCAVNAHRRMIFALGYVLYCG